MNDDALVIYFPGMLDDGAAPGQEAVPGLMLLEPGWEKDPDPKRFHRPSSLPLDPRAARSWLSQTMEFGERFKRAGDLSGLGAVGMPDFYSGSSMAIRDELRGMERSKAEAGPEEGSEEDSSFMQAQMVLVLALGLEQKRLEMADLDDDVGRAWKSLSAGIGLDQEEGAEALPGFAAPGKELVENLSWLEEGGLTWKPVLDAFFRLLPGHAVILADDPGLCSVWEESGLNFLPLDPEPLEGLNPAWPGVLSGRVYGATAPGFVWLGMSRVPDDRPWLEAERTLLRLAPND